MLRMIEIFGGEATNGKVKGEEVIIGDPQIDNDGSNNGGYEDGGDSFGREESENSGVRLEWWDVKGKGR